VLGTTVIWTTLPGIGGLIFGDYGKAALCLGVAAVAAVAMLALMPRPAAPTPPAG